MSIAFAPGRYRPSRSAIAVVFFGDGLLVAGGHDVREKYTATAATYRLR